jgi:hypothetical protein
VDAAHIDVVSPSGGLSWLAVSPKDRTREERPDRDVRIQITRSSTHPVEYAVVLLVRRDGSWHTVRVYDNAHDPEVHHEHCYVGEEKQSPTVRHGPVNDAMHAAIVTCRRSWADIVRAWETTR